MYIDIGGYIDKNIHYELCWSSYTVQMKDDLSLWTYHTMKAMIIITLLLKVTMDLSHNEGYDHYHTATLYCYHTIGYIL